jgi:hypothetical protein
MPGSDTALRLPHSGRLAACVCSEAATCDAATGVGKSLPVSASTPAVLSNRTVPVAGAIARACTQAWKRHSFGRHSHAESQGGHARTKLSGEQLRLTCHIRTRSVTWMRQVPTLPRARGSRVRLVRHRCRPATCRSGWLQDLSAANWDWYLARYPYTAH